MYREDCNYEPDAKIKKVYNITANCTCENCGAEWDEEVPLEDAIVECPECGLEG